MGELCNTARQATKAGLQRPAALSRMGRRGVGARSPFTWYIPAGFRKYVFLLQVAMTTAHLGNEFNRGGQADAI